MLNRSYYCTHLRLRCDTFIIKGSADIAETSSAHTNRVQAAQVAENISVRTDYRMLSMCSVLPKIHYTRFPVISP